MHGEVGHAVFVGAVRSLTGDAVGVADRVAVGRERVGVGTSVSGLIPPVVRKARFLDRVVRVVANVALIATSTATPNCRCVCGVVDMIPCAACRAAVRVVRALRARRPAVVVARHLRRRQRHSRGTAGVAGCISITAKCTNTDQSATLSNLCPRPTEEGPWISVPNCDVNRSNREHFIN